MAQFAADIAGMLEIFAIASGLIVLHFAAKQHPATFLKIAGWVLTLGGILMALCTSYYWLKYQSAGEFDSTHVRCSGMMFGPGGMGPGLLPPRLGPPG